MWCFGGVGIWIWCSADNNISNWWIFSRSGSKIRFKKFIFQSYFLLSNNISATGDLWKCFLEIINHMAAYYKEYHILFVAMASTLDLQYGQSWYVWRKMPSLTVMIVTIFLADIPHLNYQINIRECFDTIVSIIEGHAPGNMISILDFQSGDLLWPILQIGNFLRYNRSILYISLSKVQWCVHGHWIHMQRSYEVNVIITLVFWFNPACSIYVKNIMIFLSTIVPSKWRFQISDLAI